MTKRWTPLVAPLAAICCLFTGCSGNSGQARENLSPQQQHGKRVFETSCAICHDVYSTQPRQGPGLKGLYKKQYLPSGAPANDDRVRDAFLLGRRDMPAFQNVLDEQQVSDLLAYLHSL